MRRVFVRLLFVVHERVLLCSLVCCPCGSSFVGHVCSGAARCQCCAGADVATQHPTRQGRPRYAIAVAAITIGILLATRAARVGQRPAAVLRGGRWTAPRGHPGAADKVPLKFAVHAAYVGATLVPKNSEVAPWQDPSGVGFTAPVMHWPAPTFRRFAPPPLVTGARGGGGGGGGRGGGGGDGGRPPHAHCHPRAARRRAGERVHMWRPVVVRRPAARPPAARQDRADEHDERMRGPPSCGGGCPASDAG